MSNYITSGIALATGPAMNFLGNEVASRFTPSHKASQRQLSLEVESFKTWLSSVKRYIEGLLRNKLNLCTLMDAIDSMNALQIFFFDNFLLKSTLNNQFISKWPEFYRTELEHGISHLQRSLMEVLLELQTYNEIIAEEFSDNEANDLTRLRKLLKDKNSSCRIFADEYREFKTRDDWDICERCTQRSANNGWFDGATESLTLHESYRKFIENNMDFQEARKRIAKGEYVTDVLSAPLYAKHGKELLTKPKQAYLGNKLGDPVKRKPEEDKNLSFHSFNDSMNCDSDTEDCDSDESDD